jgi:predicted nucleotidyltransferase component of viral defense system
MPRFSEIVDHAMRNPDLAGMRPVIEKEILHYDIMFALEKEGLFENLVFQGGTALRLCHGAPRFSEDLDFVGGRGFAAAQLREIRLCIEGYIGKRYGLEVQVKEPREMREEPAYLGLSVDRWQVAVVTSAGRPNLPKQKIKLEVANVPSYRPELRSPVKNYDWLPAGYEDVLIPTESLDEILADKVVSLVACDSHPRYRDIWDIRWLRQRSAALDVDLVRLKLEDYRSEDYPAKLDRWIGTVASVAEGKTFSDEMSRFIPLDVLARTFRKPGFTGFLGRDVREVLSMTRDALDPDRSAAEFVM